MRRGRNTLRPLMLQVSACYRKIEIRWRSRIAAPAFYIPDIWRLKTFNGISFLTRSHSYLKKVKNAEMPTISRIALISPSAFFRNLYSSMFLQNFEIQLLRRLPFFVYTDMTNAEYCAVYVHLKFLLPFL